jgi:hypothetical protein
MNTEKRLFCAIFHTLKWIIAPQDCWPSKPPNMPSCQVLVLGSLFYIVKIRQFYIKKL